MKKVFYKGYWYKGKNANDLIEKICREFPSKRSILEEYVPSAMLDLDEPTGVAVPQKKETPKKSTIKFEQLVAGANALFKVTRGKVVSQEEINRRASICQSCVIDGEPGTIIASDCIPCGFASRLNNFITKLKRQFGKGFNIPNNMEKKGCSVCKCALSIMLPSEMSTFNYEKDKQDQRPDHCWVKKTSPNHIP